MLVLALDTAESLCAAAVWDGAMERGRAVEEMRTGHAERLMGVIDAALRAAGASFADLGRVGVCVGPGSFTGVRVGVSAARGLALGLSVPAVGVSRLDALAVLTREALGDQPVLVALASGEDSVQAAAYDANGALRHGPALVPNGTALAWGEGAAALAGSAAERLGTALTGRALAHTDGRVDVGVYARLAAQGESQFKPTPLYLRAPDAKPQAGALPRRAPA